MSEVWVGVVGGIGERRVDERLRTRATITAIHTVIAHRQAIVTNAAMSTEVVDTQDFTLDPNRSAAAWRVTPSAGPILYHEMP